MSADDGSFPEDHGQLAGMLLSTARFDPSIPPLVEFTGELSVAKTGLARFVAEEGGPLPLLREVSIYYRLSALAEAAGMGEAAVALADRAISLDVAHAGARLVKAKALIAAGNHKKAIGVLDEALKRDPKLGAAHLMKARSLRARDHFDRAVDSYREAFASSPAPEPLVEAGGCWLALGQAEKAEKLFGEAKLRFGGEKGRLAAGAREIAAEARTKRRPDVLKGVLRSFGEDPLVWAEMARALRDGGEPERAVRCYEKALALGGPPALQEEMDAAKTALGRKHRCPACDGDGRCRGCRDGKCTSCKGSGECGDCDGEGVCPGCGGSEKCAECRGRGKLSLLKQCDECDGSGVCMACDDGICPKCGETGECPGCGGRGECVECSGSSKCRVCKGSGSARDL